MFVSPYCVSKEMPGNREETSTIPALKMLEDLAGRPTSKYPTSRGREGVAVWGKVVQGQRKAELCLMERQGSKKASQGQ